MNENLCEMQKKGKTLEDAIKFATDAHAGVKRKGKNRAYILHPLEAMIIAASLTDDEEVLAAAVLHDTVEDTDVTKAQLECEFGRRVAELVAAESEDKRVGTPAAETWELRKQETIDHLFNASREAKLICLGDKLANLRELARDHAKIGDALWARFNQKDKTKHAWYYRSVLEILKKEFGAVPATVEYAGLLSELFGKGSD